MTSPRLLLVALLLSALTGVGVAVAQHPTREPAPREPAREGSAPRVSPPAPAKAPDRAAPEPALSDAAAIAVLRGWDRRRAAAWSAGNGAALRGLYVPGSAAGRRDLAMLRAWTSRGLRVRGLRMQVLAVRVRVHRERRVVLEVTDRVARAIAVGDGVRRELPRDGASTRAVELVRSATRWRVAAVRPRGR